MSGMRIFPELFHCVSMHLYAPSLKFIDRREGTREHRKERERNRTKNQRQGDWSQEAEAERGGRQRQREGKLVFPFDQLGSPSSWGEPTGLRVLGQPTDELKAFTQAHCIYKLTTLQERLPTRPRPLEIYTGPVHSKECWFPNFGFKKIFLVFLKNYGYGTTFFFLLFFMFISQCLISLSLHLLVWH